jgi:hypothetical protein
MIPTADQIKGITTTTIIIIIIIIILLLLSSSSSSSSPFYISPSDRNGMTKVPCDKN